MKLNDRIKIELIGERLIVENYKFTLSNEMKLITKGSSGPDKLSQLFGIDVSETIKKSLSHKRNASPPWGFITDNDLGTVNTEAWHEDVHLLGDKVIRSDIKLLSYNISGLNVNNYGFLGS